VITIDVESIIPACCAQAQAEASTLFSYIMQIPLSDAKGEQDFISHGYFLVLLVLIDNVLLCPCVWTVVLGSDCACFGTKTSIFIGLYSVINKQ
jgi:hypothetical protein